MSNKLENLLIIDAFKTLEISPWKIRKVFLKELRTNNKVIINGFTFIEDTYVFQIWKSTNIEKEPQYKGESLLKVIPVALVDAHEWKRIKDCLESQFWAYF